jgi:outer membrane protein TolC
MLVFGSGVTLFLNSYLDTVARAIAIDGSRYAALADQNYETAQAYLDNKIATLLPQIKVTTSVQRDEFALVKLTYQPLGSAWLIGAKPVQIKVVTPVETF